MTGGHFFGPQNFCARDGVHSLLLTLQNPAAKCLLARRVEENSNAEEKPMAVHGGKPVAVCRLRGSTRRAYHVTPCRSETSTGGAPDRSETAPHLSRRTLSA